MYSTGNKIVDEVGMINIEGNVIPHAWYSHFKLSSGKPDLNAMIILSEIVYWYRPTTVRDEATGSVTGVKKKFKADLLQRSYDSFANQFGLTKRQVKEAMDRLCDSRVIWRDFRTINANIKITNVLFIGINTDVLSHVSALHGGTLKSNTLPRSNVPPSHDKTSHPPTLERKTNTDNTTGITTDSTTDTKGDSDEKQKPKDEPKQPNISFDEFWNEYDKKVGDKDKICKKWLELSDDERLATMKHIAQYKAAQPNKKYRKNPETYLNQKSWNDEVIFDDSQKRFGSANDSLAVNQKHRPGQSSIVAPNTTFDFTGA